jgi:hypothetical protein
LWNDGHGWKCIDVRNGDKIVSMTAKSGSCYNSANGHFYKETKYGTIAQCEALCTADSKCKYFTYEQSTLARCWLMDGLTHVGTEAHWKCFKKKSATAVEVESSVADDFKKQTAAAIEFESSVADEFEEQTEHRHIVLGGVCMTVLLGYYVYYQSNQKVKEYEYLLHVDDDV